MFSNNNQLGQYYDRGNKAPPNQYCCYGETNPAPLHNQVMIPAPTGLPWNIQSMPWGTQSPPTLVEFNGQLQESSIKQKFPLKCKRKCDIEVPIPLKQMRTDEVMAAHLNCLHISSDFTAHSSAAGNVSLDENFVDTNTSNSDIIERLKAERLELENRLKTAERIVLCEEMRKLKNEPLIPQSIIDKLEKPCMSLVLWKPPDKCASNGLNNNNNNEEKFMSSRSVRRTRRSVLVPDMNAMDIEL